MALDKTESAILGAVVALALGGAVLWLTGGTSTPEPVQPAPLPPAAGAPPAGSGQGAANPVQQINDILQGAAKGGLKLPQLPGQTAPQGGSGQIKVSQPIALSMSDEVEPIRAEQYASNDPYCALPTTMIGTAQGGVYQAHKVLRNGIAPTPWAEEKEFGDAVFAKLKNDKESPYYGKIDTSGTETARKYIEALVAPLLTELDRKEVTVTVHVVSGNVPSNAAMMFGGHMLVMQSLIKSGPRTLKSEAELVAVIAHEIGHAELRHLSLALDLSRQGGGPSSVGEVTSMAAPMLYQFVNKLYSRELEDEADRYAVERLLRLSYSPYEFERMWRRWDAETPSPISGNKPVTQAEMETALLADHSPPRMRACLLRPLIQDYEKRTTLALFYKGKKNLDSRTSLRQRAF